MVIRIALEATTLRRGRSYWKMNTALLREGNFQEQLRYCWTEWSKLKSLLRSDLSWVDQVNYTVKKAWKALHFTMRILKKGNSNTRSLAYRSLYVQF